MRRDVAAINLILAALTAGLLQAAIANAEEPLHQRIDALISAGANGLPAAPLADDATFLRRASLDLAGCIPKADEVRDFLADADPDKRTKLVDRLLASPEHPRRMQELLHVTLMERRGDHPEWQKFLQAAAQANTPWDQLVREVLCPLADNETKRGAAFFYTKRLEAEGQQTIDHPGLTRDIGRLFLGLDLQCAQCHDHLFIDDYKQRDFQGLFAAYQNTFIKSDASFPAITEKLKPEKLHFVSVFESTQQTTGPRVPGGPEFDVPTAGAAPPDAKYSPVSLLGGALPKADNVLFTRNIANRLWFVMLGRGLVHPLDLQHRKNPPSHPELLDLLARELTAQQFNMRWLLREIALSQTYQRASAMPQGQALPPADRFLMAVEKRLSAEQLLWSTLVATDELQRAVTPTPAADGKPATAPIDELRKKFIDAFANPAREPEVEYQASVKGALFLLNDDRLVQMLKPRAGNLAERLGAMSDVNTLADEIYLSVLSRLPTNDEKAEVADYLNAAGKRREVAIGQLTWALLSSLEFGVNH